MRIHHLNCVSACPLGGYLTDGTSTRSLRGQLTCHCLLLEDAHSLVLVDTGYGLRDIADPPGRLSQVFLTLQKPDLREEMTAIRQVERLGFDPRDVRHILLSHLDFDHAGGLDDFPEATVHLMANELHAALMRPTVLDRMRYRPQQWKTRTKWKTYSAADGNAWNGFARVQALEGIASEVVMVPLVGHTLGHAGVAVRGLRDQWFFYTGDAYFHHGEMHADHPHCPPGLRLYQTLMEKRRGLRLANQHRLRELARLHPEVTVFCAHDVREFEALSHRSASVPATLPPASPMSNGALGRAGFSLGLTSTQEETVRAKGHHPS